MAERLTNERLEELTRGLRQVCSEADPQSTLDIYLRGNCLCSMPEIVVALRQLREEREEWSAMAESLMRTVLSQP